MKQKPLVVNPIPVPSQYKHPPPPYDQLPTHEFTMGLIAPKGAGKTTVICNLLHFYKNYFHTILVFSPTINSDEKWVMKNEFIDLVRIGLKDKNCWWRTNPWKNGFEI